MDFDDAILYAEYESFSCGSDVTKGLDVGFHVEYESFSFGSVIPDLLFKLDNNILYVEYESCPYEFEVGEQSDTVSELDISVTSEVEPRNLDESKEDIS